MLPPLPNSTLFPYTTLFRSSINSHGFVGDDSQKTIDDAFPAFAQVMDQIGRERGWPPMTKAQFEASCSLHGDRKSTRLNSSHVAISYAVFCLKKKTKLVNAQ